MGGWKWLGEGDSEGHDLHLYTSTEKRSSNTDKLTNIPFTTFTLSVPTA